VRLLEICNDVDRLKKGITWAKQTIAEAIKKEEEDKENNELAEKGFENE